MPGRAFFGAFACLIEKQSVSEVLLGVSGQRMDHEVGVVVSCVRDEIWVPTGFHMLCLPCARQ
jgi:hypothetical protein